MIASAVPRAASKRLKLGVWLSAFALVAAAVAGVALYRGRPVAGGSGDTTTVVAIGRIQDYRRDDRTEIARPLADMLATNLARVSGLRVVSTARMYELLQQGAGLLRRLVACLGDGGLALGVGELLPRLAQGLVIPEPLGLQLAQILRGRLQPGAQLGGLQLGLMPLASGQPQRLVLLALA